MIHVFHGFLGNPTDFDFLKGDGVICHDLLSLNPNELKVGPNDVLIGYSMGGRIALEIASRINFALKKIVLINAHPGLSDEEKNSRGSWEDEIKERMLAPSFMDHWNALAVFNNDRPISGPRDISPWRELFDRFRLSRQKNFLPELTHHKDKVLWLIGEDDEKYQALARTHLKPADLCFRTIAGGHRSFQHPEAIIKALSQEKIL